MGLNRSIFVVRPTGEFLDWLISLDEEEFTLEQVASDATAYLVPLVDCSDQLANRVADFWEQIFEDQLEEWSTDETTWPSPRSLSMFQRWFDVQLHATVIDLADLPIMEFE